VAWPYEEPDQRVHRGHAWVELDGKVYDWQHLVALKLGPQPRRAWYAKYKPTNVQEYRQTDVLINMLKHKHHGPWG